VEVAPGVSTGVGHREIDVTLEGIGIEVIEALCAEITKAGDDADVVRNGGDGCPQWQDQGGNSYNS
jgi:hypothetical protein